MRKISIVKDGIEKKVELDDDAELRTVLSSRCLSSLVSGELFATDSEGNYLTQYYIPSDGEVITIEPYHDEIKTTDFKVVANRYGEDISATEYLQLRQQLEGKGKRLWDLRIQEALELVK